MLTRRTLLRNSLVASKKPPFKNFERRFFTTNRHTKRF